MDFLKIHFWKYTSLRYNFRIYTFLKYTFKPNFLTLELSSEENISEIFEKYGENDFEVAAATFL